MHDQTVLRVVTKILLPFLLLFAFYVQMHGEYSPGGGFQAGVILGTTFILYALIFGLDEARCVLPPFVVHAGAALGLLIYAGTGMAALYKGGRYLDYSFLSDNAAQGQQLGIMLVELGVGLTVASVMLGLFYLFGHFGKR